jgi:hypothetical protein
LIFYYPKEVTDTGEVIFDTKLIRMSTSAKRGETIFNNAIKLLNSDCPKDNCEWCGGR